MNIFALHEEPVLAAQAHFDVHVRKMMVEYAQILSTAQWALKGSVSTLVYKPAYFNHPSVKWARASLDNYMWLFSLWSALNDEYGFRFETGHKSWLDLSDLLATPPSNLPSRGLLPLFLAIGDDYKGHKCETFYESVMLYREYYQNSKAHLCRYTKRTQPKWLHLSQIT